MTASRISSLGVAFRKTMSFADTYEAQRRHIVNVAKDLAKTSAIFTKWGRKEAATMTLAQVEDTFGTTAAHFVCMLRSGVLVSRRQQ